MGLFGSRKKQTASFLSSENERKEKKFLKAPLQEDTRVLLNPRRGWYEIYQFRIEETPDFEELKWCLREEETLALLRFDLRAVRSAVISEEQLACVDRILRFFEEAGKNTILRFAYDTEGKGSLQEPSDMALILYHIAQLGSIVRKHEKSVFVFQGLLTGSWGEMHHTSYGTQECVQKLAAGAAKALGKHIYMAVRRPVHRRYLSEEEAEQVGFFNDGLFGSPTHLGTFGEKPKSVAMWTEAWCEADEVQYTERVCAAAPNGGEAVRGEHEVSFEKIRETMSRLRITYLNCVYDEAILNSWKKKTVPGEGVWGGKSLYAYIGAHLGYRLLVTEVKGKTGLTGTPTLRITIRNTGFAPLYDRTRLEAAADGNVRAAEELPAPLPNGGECEITLRLPAAKGRVRLTLTSLLDGRELFFGNAGEETGESGLWIGTFT